MGNVEAGAGGSGQGSDEVANAFYRLYTEKLLPVEKRHLYHQIQSASEFGVEDFSAKPMVLLLGPYSTGKTSFVQHLLGRDYPGIRISPEPTTDKFVCLIHGEAASVEQGHVVVADSRLPFASLRQFGDVFLNSLECIRIPREAGRRRVLEDLMLIDSPGVLPGERLDSRGYDFNHVIQWFGDHVDVILLFFDVSKLDISDDLKAAIKAISDKNRNGQKLRIVLNKADQVPTAELMRIYGALMWALRGVFATPEVPRVYIGSFWDKPLKEDDQRALFEDDKRDLHEMLRQLSRNAAVRKLNLLIRRAKQARAHAKVMDHIRSNAPVMLGKEQYKKQVLNDLPAISKAVSVESRLPLGDFPEPQTMRAGLETIDFGKLLVTVEKLDPAQIESLGKMIDEDIPALLRRLPGQMQADLERERWLQRPNENDYKRDFNKLEPKGGKVQVKKALATVRIPKDVVEQIHALIGHDESGQLSLYEYALAMNFVDMTHEGHALPESLPESMRKLEHMGRSRFSFSGR